MIEVMFTSRPLSHKPISWADALTRIKNTLTF